MARSSKVCAVLCTLLLALLTGQSAMAAGGQVTDQFQADALVACGGSINASLTLNGQSPPPTLQPVDVMLTLDRSGSMNGAGMSGLKSAAHAFVDHMDNFDGANDDNITASRVGLVSFADTANLDAALTHNAAALNAAITGLVANGNTNISHGIDLAQAQLAGSMAKRVMIFMSDGNPTRTNRGGNPTTDAIAAANAAKSAGTEIYAIGLGASISTSLLQNIASGNDHVYIAPTGAQLQQIFQTIATKVAGPAATGMQYRVQNSDDFSVTAATATKGAVAMTPDGFVWTLSELSTESVSISYTMAHTGTTNGLKPAHAMAQLSWMDDDGQPQQRSYDGHMVMVTGCNHPPVADAGPDQVLPMTGPAGAAVTLDGSASTDDGQNQPLTYNWNEGPTVLGTGATLSHTFPLGVHSVTLTVFDGEFTATDEVMITIEDRMAPVTTITLTGSMGSGGWYVSAVGVSVTADDNPGGSGVDYTSVLLDGGAAGTAFTVGVDGNHTVQAHSVDHAGNSESEQVVSFKVDTMPPDVAATLSPAAPSGSNGWYTGAVQVALTASDATSGVAAIEYSVNGGAWQAYVGPGDMDADGLYDVAFRAADQAGNQSAVSHATFRIDSTAPMLSVTSPMAANYSPDQMIAIAWSAADAMSGVASSTAMLDGAPVANGQMVDALTLSLGAHTLTVTATDLAGNSTTVTVSFEVMVTYDSLEAVKHHFYAMGWIDNEGTVKSLDQKLRAALSAHDKGNHNAENNILGAFLSEVAAQRGKHITNAAADYLTKYARWLMNHH